MYTIGEFASFGRVSVRMLRHYDAIGLLKPARVDPYSGYRYYEPEQFAALGRIVGLRDLGIGLEQIRGVVDGSTDAAAHRALLHRRRAELEAQIAADRARISRLDERLHHLEGGAVMSTDVELKSIPSVTVFEGRADAPGFGPENASPVVGPLFDRVAGALEAAGIPLRDPAYALYEAVDDEDGPIVVRAGFPADPGDVDPEGLERVELPPVELAASLVHHGVMARIGDSWMHLMRWIEESGYSPSGIGREVYLVSGMLPEEEWVTELQQPVTKL
ncbi:MerR family transcriptional regulator [Microbacterium sp. 4R-513]|uniref:MerR family transcriptional regulator n=1 Tax=Microbacterium sp. 4R-513 TaxID=2567934 RepID=UPI0013E1E990|nr:MerR family transcriptional regulator [Microbacterium sp. 4R-513]QIG40155.1 MerR family transcriptional regulator [Microbacterium sp. 4R-513]